MHVLTAQLKKQHEGCSDESWIPHITGTDEPFDGHYQHREGLYRAVDGDQVQFFAYNQPGQGFGGRHFDITMIDGSKKTLIGPWSSRAGCINMMWPEDDPIVECIKDKYTQCFIKLSALTRLGLRFKKTEPWNDGEIYYRPIP